MYSDDDDDGTKTDDVSDDRTVPPTFSTFHVTFIKLINVDKNNKRVY